MWILAYPLEMLLMFYFKYLIKTYLFGSSRLRTISSDFWTNSLIASEKTVEEMADWGPNIMILRISQDILQNIKDSQYMKHHFTPKT
jgi:hypothetical protein